MRDLASRAPIPVFQDQNAVFSEQGNATDVVWDIVVSIGQAIVHVESQYWIFGFLVGGYIFACTTGACMPASMRSTAGWTKSGSAWPLNIDRLA